MPEHFTRNTVSVEFWCAKCTRFTQHRVDEGRKGPCLRCIDKLDAQHAAEKPKPPEQGKLF
jgi:ribosomal protein L44E